MKRIGDAIQTRTQAKDPQSYHVIPYRGGTWGHNGKTSPANKTRAKQIKVKNAPLVYRGGGTPQSKAGMRTPGVESGSPAWGACMMPLHYVHP